MQSRRLFVMAFAACLSVVAPAALPVCAAEHTEDSLTTVQENLTAKKAVLIDVREPAEWQRGHLTAARLLPLSELKRAGTDPAVKEKIEKALPKDRVVYCHCGSGVRVLAAAKILGALGYDIRPLAAGFSDLREAGFAVEKP